MKTYGDGCVVTLGLIKGDEYSYLTDSKTALWVQAPAYNATQRGVPVFFLGTSLAAVAGIWLDGKSYAFIFPLLVVAGMAAWSLIKGLTGKARNREWKLYMGSTENPILIFSAADAAVFETKRSEIEQTLLGRPLNEEK